MQISWSDTIFDSTIPFDDRCLKVYQFQAADNPVYNKFISSFGLSGHSDLKPGEIPLLPVRAFRDLKLLTGYSQYRLFFKSSGTGNMERSIHCVPDPSIYRKAIHEEFRRYFDLNEYSILCYTPVYHENRESSLIWMLNELVQSDPSGLSRFLPLDQRLSRESYAGILEKGKKILLFGAAFGLLDLIDLDSDPLPAGTQIVETGGMKTHRREISREELRKKLSDGFECHPSDIHSEYGMCELLGQMYAIGDEWFTAPHWVRVTIRSGEDPSKICLPGQPGKIAIIDLANVYSSSFILTDDKGIMDESGRFKVLGRWNNSQMRGCNFLIDRD